MDRELICEHAEIVKVIRVTGIVGKGVSYDPVRKVELYWDLEGNKIAEIDPFNKPINQKND